MDRRDMYKVDVPEAHSGNWRIVRESVGTKEASKEAMYAVVRNNPRYVPEGTYTVLYRGGTLVMSDTPDEIRDHISVIHEAHGRCLVAGLGLGVVARAMLMKDEVESVTIVEASKDVIAMVGPWLTAQFGARVEIIEADILEWTPPKGSKWDIAWFDIWDTICADNLEDMRRLHRKFSRKAKWKGSWARYQCERAEREWKNSPWSKSWRS